MTTNKLVIQQNCTYNRSYW